MQKHPAVAQGVRFHSFETEELRHTLVIGTHQLRVHIGVHGRLVDLHEAVLPEGVHFEGDTENAANAEPAGSLQSGLRSGFSPSFPQKGGDLGGIPPQRRRFRYSDLLMEADQADEITWCRAAAQFCQLYLLVVTLQGCAE